MYGIYIHIPFCAKKCPYCDFYSLAANTVKREQFVKALINQITAYPAVEADSVYFGGGTPSLLTGEQISEILTAVKSHHNVTEDAEITMECNPASASLGRLTQFRQAGVNRLSVGCQSFQPKTLAALGRTHSVDACKRTVEDARRAGFSNISIDLMLGTPYQTPELARADALAAAELGVEHVSAYILKICEGTEFAKGVDGLPDEDTQADCYDAFADTLISCGYRQYEISNFCKQGFQSRHNLKYWRCGQWLGFGPSAHMSDGSVRRSFPADIDKFISIWSTALQDPLEGYVLEGEVDAEEYIMTSLRTDEGLHLPSLKKRFGHTLAPSQIDFIIRVAKEGYAEFDGETLTLTRQGYLLSNFIISGLI